MTGTELELWLAADTPACALKSGQLARLEQAGMLTDVLAVCQDYCGKALECALFRRVSRRAARRARTIRATRAIREIARVEL